jgi:hypothetical protein
LRNALVLLSDHAGRDRPPAGRLRPAHAAFVAQLIATQAQLPQTRARRRADPDQAVAAYATLGRWLNRTGVTLSQSS